MEVNCQIQASAALALRKESPVCDEQETGRSLEPVWSFRRTAKSLALKEPKDGSSGFEPATQLLSFTFSVYTTVYLIILRCVIPVVCERLIVR